MLKRLCDVFVAVVALAVTSPLLAIVAVAVRFTSPGPILHRARRIGRFGRPFTLYKFRTMVPGPASAGFGVTVRADPRITKVGRVLRITKLEELPQLLNVVRGDMSVVGPRPEDPRFVEAYTPEERGILQWRPGLTSPATLAYRHEEAVLAASADPEHTYRTVVSPEKVRIDL